MNNSEIRLEAFSEELDKLLTAYVDGGNICLKFADELHAKVVGLFEDNNQS